MNSVLIFWWTDEHMFIPIQIDKIGKNQDKSIKKMSVSSISTDLSIDKSIPIFIGWLFRVQICCKKKKNLLPLKGLVKKYGGGGGVGRGIWKFGL